MLNNRNVEKENGRKFLLSVALTHAYVRVAVLFFMADLLICACFWTNALIIVFFFVYFLKNKIFIFVCAEKHTFGIN